MKKISVSVLNMDFMNLGESIKEVETAGADSFHMDIMDGHFVDNISFGPDTVSSIRQFALLPFHTHLMISNPKKFIKRFFDAGSKTITVHIEAIENDRGFTITRNMGISLNPSAPIEKIFPYMDKISRVLIMSVNPGFGGQKFIKESIEKIYSLAQRREELGLKFIISVDGGIEPNSAALCSQAGADELVVGSYVTASKDLTVAESIKKLRKSI